MGAAAIIVLFLVSMISTALGGTIQISGKTHIIEDYLLMPVLFPIVGLITGLLQVVLLLPYLPHLRWWAAATFLGWLLPFVVMPILTALFTTHNGGFVLVAFGVSLMGLCIGLPQWLALRQQVRRAGWWLLACGLGWGVFGLINSDSAEPLILLLSVALVPAAFTGAAWWLLLDWLPRRESVKP